MAFATATEWKTSRKIAGSGFDTEIAGFIASAQSIAESYCGYSQGGFEHGERTYTFDGDGSQILKLPDAPIDTAETVTVSRIDDAGTATALDATEYRVVGPQGLIHRLPHDTSRGRFDGPDGWAYSPNWAEGVQNWRVVCTTGWVVSGAGENRPKGLLEAVYKLVDTLGAERGSSLLRASIAAGSENYTRLDAEGQARAMGWWFGPWRRSRL